MSAVLTKMMRSLVFFACLLSACASEAPGTDSQKIAREGVEVWVKVSGPKMAPPAIFLHGGPGDNSFIFERSVGAKLESKLRMVYLDQRGSGRSSLVDEDLLGLEDIVRDVEHVRAHLELEKVSFIAHSFGGLVALEYQRLFPDRVARILFIDITADLASLVLMQVQFMRDEGPRLFPEHAAAIQNIIDGSDPMRIKLGKLHGLVGPKRIQRWIQFSSEERFRIFDQWMFESGLRNRSRNRVAARIFGDGYFDSSHPELMKPVPVPSQLFVGRHSRIVARPLIEGAAKAWGAPIVWFEQSGHFPFFDEPDAFASAAIEFLTAP